MHGASDRKHLHRTASQILIPWRAGTSDSYESMSRTSIRDRLPTRHSGESRSPERWVGETCSARACPQPRALGQPAPKYRPTRRQVNYLWEKLILAIAPYYADHESHVEIYNRDSTDLSFLPPAGIHLVVTSPPYNLGKDYGTARDDKTYQQYLDWTKQWGAALTHVLTPGSRVCVNIPIDINLAFQANGRKTATKQAVLADMTRLFVHELGYIYNTTILWLERNVSRRTAWGSWLSASDPWVNTAAEAILVLSHQTRKRNGRGRQSDLERDEFMDWVLGLWDFPGESRTQYRHPAAFPEELPRRLIKLFSFPGDTVLDPFLGSGTTCAVAKKLGRRAIGLDIDPHFCSVAAKRCDQVAPPASPIHVPDSDPG